MYPGTPLFKALTDKEEHEFRMYARKNPPEDMEKWYIYHPICREEWMRQGIGLDLPEPLNENWVDPRKS